MNKPRRRTSAYYVEHFGSGINILLLIVIALIMLYPFWYIFMYSLSTYEDVIGKGLILRPYGFTMENIMAVVKNRLFIQSYKNTIFVVVVGTALSVLTTALFAYPLSRNVRGTRFFNFLVYFTMLFSGGMIPLYYVVRVTGLLDSLWSLIIPALVSPFNIFVMRTFFSGISRELVESAQIDGASEMRIFWKIIVPLSKPVMATITLFYAVGYWNKFMDAVLYIRSADKRPLQLLLKELIASSTNEMFSQIITAEATAANVTAVTLKMATVTLSVVPVMVIYPFLQKYFVKGVMLGSVKG